MKLEDIGFYTLEDLRAKNTSQHSPLWRCELILTDRCNYSCPYCRGMLSEYSYDIGFDLAKNIIDLWAEGYLKNIRFSGGEPCLYNGLPELVEHAKKSGINRIAVSTNGSINIGYYKNLIDAGVNDFSISFDACCSSTAKEMSGRNIDFYNKTIDNIKALSKLTYVTLGVVITDANSSELNDIVKLGLSLGVADIRIISAAQINKTLTVSVNDSAVKELPILNYRLNNYKNKRNVRGITSKDCHQCPLVLDDMAVAQGYHFPCIIYFREQGKPIGKMNGDIKATRRERYDWFVNHNSFSDDICRNNCLDVCIDYNNKCEEYNGDNR